MANNDPKPHNFIVKIANHGPKPYVFIEKTANWDTENHKKDSPRLQHANTMKPNTMKSL